MTNLDFNSDGEQRSFDVVPAGTICILQMTVRPGSAGDGGWLKRASDGQSDGLDCEFTVVEGQFAKKALGAVDSQWHHARTQRGGRNFAQHAAGNSEIRARDSAEGHQRSSSGRAEGV